MYINNIDFSMSGQPAELYITSVILGVRRCYSMWPRQNPRSQLISWSAGLTFNLCVVSRPLQLVQILLTSPCYSIWRQKSANQLVSLPHFYPLFS